MPHRGDRAYDATRHRSGSVPVLGRQLFSWHANLDFLTCFGVSAESPQDFA